MEITYDKILNALKSKYHVVERNNHLYLVDDNARFVASYDENKISMFLNFPSNNNEIFNHFGRIVVTFIRNFQVNNVVADIVVVHGLCGASNDVELTGDFACSTINNKDFYFESIEEKEEFQNSLKIMNNNRQEINSSNNAPSSTLNSEFGTCGKIYVSNHIADIEIADSVRLNQINVLETEDDIMPRVNVITVKGIKEDYDFSKVFEYWRKENDWFFNTDNTRSDFVIEWTYRREFSTVDKNSINLVGNPFSYLYESLYNNKSPYDDNSLEVIKTK